MDSIILFFQILVLVYSAIIHEYMHGWAADQLGDPTAKSLGRLTLNPLPHIDIYGSLVLPILMILSGVGFVFGWAKPVPYNPDNLSNQKYGSALVALAGPAGNIFTAVVFGLLLRFLLSNPDFLPVNDMMLIFISLIAQINLVLAVFNLMPIPPLDGSKVITPFLPYAAQVWMANLEKYGMFIVLLFVIFGFSMIFPVIDFLFRIIVGV
jgi:Zn-dependent protease